MTDIDEIEAEFEEYTEDKTEAEKELENFLADLGTLSNVKITVYRVLEGKKQSWVTAFEPSEFDMEALFTSLRQDYNGGTFKIQVRESGRIVKNRQIDIEPPPKEADRFKQLEQALEQKMNGSSDVTRMMADMQRMNMEMFQRQSESQQNMMTAILGVLSNNKSSAPAIDPIQMQATMLESVRALRDLSTPEKSPDQTELILKGIELATTLRESSEGGDANMYSVLSKALGTFGGVMAQGAGQSTGQSANQTAAQSLPAQQIQQKPAQNTQQANAQSAQSATAQPTSPDLPLLFDGHPLKPFEPVVHLLVNRARKGASPVTYAEYIIDEIGEEMAQEWIVKDEGRAVLLEQFPYLTAEPILPWLLELASEVETILAESVSDDSDDTVDDDAEGTDTSGHASIAPEPTAEENTAYADGVTVRPSGDSQHATLDGATGRPIENESAGAGAVPGDSPRHTG